MTDTATELQGMLDAASKPAGYEARHELDKLADPLARYAIALGGTEDCKSCEDSMFPGCYPHRKQREEALRDLAAAMEARRG